MYLVIWTYRVKEEHREAFETLYGEAGDWVDWFRGSPDFISTELLRSSSEPLTYLTIDRWKSRSAYEDHYKTGGKRYDELDARGDLYTLDEVRLGAFESGD